MFFQLLIIKIHLLNQLLVKGYFAILILLIFIYCVNDVLQIHILIEKFPLKFTHFGIPITLS